ncbi:unnamed protein product [Orchesella dallaii]|uniref:Probable ATP-dependent RNA helicase spindle-E n=1 Tax=Orchesella dallaii TaxID=48710 RepID=A0ABP1QSP6_9HEXA
MTPPLSVDHGNDETSEAARNNGVQQTTGRKRPRETEEHSADERPIFRIKTEVELAEFQDYDDEEPKTPLMPTVEDGEVDVGARATIRADCELPAVPSTSQGGSFSNHEPPTGVVKSEPVDVNDDHQENQPFSTPSSSKKNDDTTEEEPIRPSISGFFGFASGPQIQPTLPNSVEADIKVTPAPIAQMAHYNSHTAEEESKYGGDDGTEKIKPIPLPMTTKRSDSEGSEDESENCVNESSPRISRYIQRSNVYEKYDFERRAVDATRLAVYEKKAVILSSIEKSRVTIVEGFTGCGKTTQVPQYILDKCREEKRVCNIVVTQPRKIAAISVARRVCYERKWTLGSVVGYQVGMDTVTNKSDTLLTFMTTGVLLQKLLSLKSLKEFTHIIIDEVHERDLESDFLLLIIKKIMAADTEGKEAHVKLVLMSATINTGKFSDYFMFRNENEQIQIPPQVIKIPAVRAHLVEYHYLDGLLSQKTDLLNMIGSNLDLNKATIQEEVYDVAVSCIIDLDNVERSENPDPRLKKMKTYADNRGSVLVFLPGMEEIRKMHRALDMANKEKINDQVENPKRDCNFYRWTILPLHSSVTNTEQERVFQPSHSTFRKVILSTNIAESSVTVPDIAYVIDFCLTKSLCVDKVTNFTTLRMIWAARSQCTQRAGRTGRVANGKVYRLLPSKFYNDLEKEIQPEMLRSNLETVILMCKKFGFDSPSGLLTDALDRPNLSGIERAISTLKELGALTIEMLDERTGKLRYSTSDGDLTFLGQVMSSLPIPQQCTRLIMLGHAFGVMHEAVIIAAALSVKSPFLTGFREQLSVYKRKMDFAQKSFSDLFAVYHLYQHWICNFAESGGTKQYKYDRERSWAFGAQINLQALREIKATVESLWDRLKRLNIKDSYSVVSSKDTVSQNRTELTQVQGIFLKLAIAGAFYPNYFLRHRPDARQHEREVNRQLCGHDGHQTVYFKGWQQSHDGRLYAKHIAQYLGHGLSEPAVKFDGSKVLAIFDKSEMIGPFSKAIFLAIKQRQLKEQLKFQMLWPEYERDELHRWKLHVDRRGANPCPSQVNLPSIRKELMSVKVQHIVSPSQFWVVYKEMYGQLLHMEEVIGRDNSGISLPRRKCVPNGFCLAPFENKYYRARIIRIISNGERCSVYFVDYGNNHWVQTSCLYDFSPMLKAHNVHMEPCFAVEARLSKIKPNSIHGLHWSKEAVDKMTGFCSKAAELELKIYSVSQSIIAGELIGYGRNGVGKCSINEILLNKADEGKQLGESASETYLSEENHRKRERAPYMDVSEMSAANFEQIGDPFDLDFIEPPKEGPNLKVPMDLKGPFSPLEMNFRPLVRSSNTKQVNIDKNSVNSVLLDHEPTSRMLVAAHVSINERSGSIAARESTVMAPVPGILSLVSMMFAPKIQLRVDHKSTRYTGVLCGCGLTPSNDSNLNRNLPVHPDNDMEIVFDTEIDDSDIDLINTIRYQLNLILGNPETINRAACHKQLGLDVVRLMNKSRNRIDEEIWPQEEYIWKEISPEFLIIDTHMVFSHNAIFHQHHKIRLNARENEEIVWNMGY